jgi:MFS family permease
LPGSSPTPCDKARIIRIVKTAEIVIMLVRRGRAAAPQHPAAAAALFAMGVHSTFFGPIKYAILPQHLEPDEVLGGTGLVEAGTYIAILAARSLGGLLVLSGRRQLPRRMGRRRVLVVAVIGRIAGAASCPLPRPRPDAPPLQDGLAHHPRLDPLVNATLHIPRLFLAIVAISFFWAMGAVLAAQFPPLVKNVAPRQSRWRPCSWRSSRSASRSARSLINRLLKGRVSRAIRPPRRSRWAVRADLYWNVRSWPAPSGRAAGLATFLDLPNSRMDDVDLFGVAVAGGMFVVPLYAFLTTTVPKSETARTIAANNIVNSGFMVLATLILTAAVQLGVTVADSLLIVAVASVVAAWLGWKLHLACD